METVDEEIRDMSFKWLDKAKADGKPFFLWLNPTRMHVVTHLSPKYERCAIRRTAGPCRSRHGAADDVVGDVMKKLKDMGGTTTPSSSSPRQRHRDLYLARRRQHAVPRAKGTIYEGGFRAPAMIRWPGKVPAGKVENGIMSGPRLVSDLVAAAGNPNIKDELLKASRWAAGLQNHLDS